MAEVTQVLSRLTDGNQTASAELLPLVYEELRKLAAAKMSHERQDHTLQATGLVHEAYLRLTDANSPRDWHSRGHFFSAAAKAMRRILIDYARSASRQKRGGDVKRLELTDVSASQQGLTPAQLLELDDSLQKMERCDPVVAELVRLRLFAGLSVRDAAKVMGISRTKAYEHWEFALAWFAVEVSG